jgi:leucyl-tRNA synthetase
MEENQAGEWELSGIVQEIAPDKAQLKMTHATIRKVTSDIESLSFNTAISQMMIFVNAFTNASVIPIAVLRPFLIVLNPFAPHIASELWKRLNQKFTDAKGDITKQSWPMADEALLVEDEAEIVVQINGKVRDRVTVPIDATEEETKAIVLASPKIQAHLVGKTVSKIVVVPKKLVNIVLS